MHMAGWPYNKSNLKFKIWERKQGNMKTEKEKKKKRKLTYTFNLSRRDWKKGEEDAGFSPSLLEIRLFLRTAIQFEKVKKKEEGHRWC